METKKLKSENSFFPTVFSDFFDNESFFGRNWPADFRFSVPAVNISENSKAFCIEFAVPGFSKNDFKVNTGDNVLTITAEKQEEKKTGKERFTRQEFSYNGFSRSFTLPKNALAEKATASYVDGILSLTIPKQEENKNNNRKFITVA